MKTNCTLWSTELQRTQTQKLPGMVVSAFNTSPLRTEAKGSGLHRETGPQKQDKIK